jgi:hypothetical protein
VNHVSQVCLQDNKLLKHILFRPSRLVLISSIDGQEQSLQVETVNTETRIAEPRESDKRHAFGITHPRH